MDVPHSARMYDYLLGGKDNYPADQAAAERVLEVVPDLRVSAVQNRLFLLRAVEFLAGEAGVDQYVDIGTGLPTSPNLHEVVQEVIPAARVLYVDNDPLVLVHARALMASRPEGRTAFMQADVRRPWTIMDGAGLRSDDETVRDVVDVSRPVALSLVALLHFLTDDMDPVGVVRFLADVLVAGSYLVISHGTDDFTPVTADRGAQVYRNSGIPVQLRSREQLAGLVPGGWDVLAPGIVPVHRWRPDGETPADFEDYQVGVYGLIARKR
jgi:hypothetical protein